MSVLMADTKRVVDSSAIIIIMWVKNTNDAGISKNFFKFADCF